MSKEHEQPGPGDEHGGPPKVQLQVQTPRGLWSVTEPKGASKRPVYPISAKIQQVIDDAREVFKFTEQDNKYVLLFRDEELKPERTLASYHFENGVLLVLSVQGGNA
jgi:hypothetical protein